MANEETKQATRPKIAINLSEVATDQVQGITNSGEESKGPFEKSDSEKKVDTAKAATLQINLSDQDSDDEIVPGEDQAENAEQLNIKKQID